MNTLGMFARHPVPGATKTRLARGIGAAAAARCSAAFVSDLIGRMLPLAERFVVSATPCTESAANWFETRLPELAALEWQVDGCLGTRIGHFFESQFGAGADAVVLTGSDSPDLPETAVRDLFHRLDGVPIVVAPAADGGFVAIGMHRRARQFPLRECLRAVPWSTSETCAETIRQFREVGCMVEAAEPWYDVDTIEDLHALASRLGDVGQGGAKMRHLPETCRVLRDLGLFAGSGPV